jgi:hypothetical protein
VLVRWNNLPSGGRGFAARQVRCKIGRGLSNASTETQHQADDYQEYAYERQRCNLRVVHATRCWKLSRSSDIYRERLKFVQPLLCFAARLLEATSGGIERCLLTRHA